jgi:exonuclease III
MASSLTPLKFLTWNVRGLGEPLKCDIVKETLRSNHLDLVLFQETKLATLNVLKSSTFLPREFNSYITLDAAGASRGLMLAWNSNKLKLVSSFSKTFSISAHLESELNATLFWVSNIYGPNLDTDRPAFFQEIRELGHLVSGPWLLAGDFNSIRFPHERSTQCLSHNETLFNETIRDAAIQEIPLLDRTFTWSNMQPPCP